ncbi:SAM-dependent methyltransferase [Jidongwangia harbinensis]|uniref:SAM-dependent methyltransferase n=1 Tax=Jidongwangia harbinensis TaxID=2878561 RepID=UPI001CD9A417|nr:SAM-dependent methyltransferase [Jidongwangia harbinensis]MCA2215887.1 SAM-dependent methyltransferase [Jidongwangia harbinensis]
MRDGLYADGGFFAGGEVGPAGHFRTSVHASPLFAGALLRLIDRVDAALGRPERIDVVDVGAGRGELLTALRAGLGTERHRFTAVEVGPRPAGLPVDIGWERAVPEPVVGVLLATEWLDNVPLDVAEVDDRGDVRRVLVDPATGVESLGGPVDAADRMWLARWWPQIFAGVAGARAEVGWTRDVAWADAVSTVRRGAALAVDYGHLQAARPPLGSLTGYRAGRQVEPVPDGTCDVTAHVAMDAAAWAAGTAYSLIGQREALHALGVDGARPPLDLARSDPAAYLRALGSAGAAAELTDPAGLGGHWWLLHTVGVPPLLGDRAPADRRGTMHG